MQVCITICAVYQGREYDAIRRLKRGNRPSKGESERTLELRFVVSAFCIILRQWTLYLYFPFNATVASQPRFTGSLVYRYILNFTAINVRL